MQHLSSKTPAICVSCGKQETTPGTFPLVVGFGRVCLSCGMQKLKCELCGKQVMRITSTRFQGRILCLDDWMKEAEKYKQHIVNVFDEDTESLGRILERAITKGPEGYTLVAIRRGRNSTHLWEAEYEKTELFQMRCS